MRISIFHGIVILLTAFCVLSCDEPTDTAYNDLRPGLQNHASVIEKTITDMSKAEDASHMSTALRPFNASMGDILSMYRNARIQHPELRNIYRNPPESLSGEIARIRELNSTLRDSLLMTAKHSDDAGLRRQVVDTISLIDTLESE